MKYRTKPCKIEAIQWTGENKEELEKFGNDSLNFGIDVEENNWSLVIHTLEGDMKANVGDYIIKGLKDEFYPCKPDVFEKKYEVIMN